MYFTVFVNQCSPCDLCRVCGEYEVYVQICYGFCQSFSAHRLAKLLNGA